MYFEWLLKKIDVYSPIKNKTTCHANGTSVPEHVIKGKGCEIGSGAMTAILLYTRKCLQLVGPLPADIQNHTSYTAAPLESGQQQPLLQQRVGFLSGPMSKPL